MNIQKIDLIVTATGTSETATLLTLIKCAIGSGLLALPFAFMLSGSLGGTLLLIVVAIFDFYSWRLMALTLQHESADSRITLNAYLLSTYGPGSVIVGVSQLATFILILGSCISYVIFMNSAIEQLIPDFTSKAQFVIPYAICLFLFLLAFSFKDAIQHLQFITVGATVLTFFVIIFVIIYCLKLIGTEQTNITPISFAKFPIVYGMVLFAYDINGIISEIRMEMELPHRFINVLAKSMAIEVCCYVLIGFLGYLAFGSSTEDIITININESIQNHSFKICYQCIILLYGLSLIGTTLLNFIPGLNTVNFFLENCLKIDSSRFSIRIIVRIVFILLIVMIPLVYPEFASILSIVGCVCSVTLGYIIPYVIYRGRFYSKIGRTETIINLSVMAMGLIGGLMGLLQNMDLLKY